MAECKDYEVEQDTSRNVVSAARDDTHCAVVSAIGCNIFTMGAMFGKAALSMPVTCWPNCLHDILHSFSTVTCALHLLPVITPMLS